MKEKENGEMSTWLFMTIPIEKQQWHVPIILPMVHAHLSIGWLKFNYFTHNYAIKNYSHFWNFANPFAAGGLFGQYKMIEKPEKWPKPWHMGTHLIVLSESYPKKTNMTGFIWFSKIFASLRFGQK